MAAERKFSRKGLHRLECPACPCYGYFTVAMLEQAGELPVCFARGCGEPMAPVELELMALLGVDHPAFEDHARRTHHKELSQFRSLGQFEIARRRTNGTLNDMSGSAFDEIRQELASASRERRLAGLGLREVKVKGSRDVVRVKIDTEPMAF